MVSSLRFITLGIENTEESALIDYIEGEGEMKRDKKYVVFMVFISFAVTGVHQSMRSTGSLIIVPFLTDKESSFGVFGEEGHTNEFYRFNSQLIPSIEHDIIPVGYFIEEERIVEEFTDGKEQIKPVLYCDEPKDFISLYLSLTNAMNMERDLHELKTEEEESCDMLIPAERWKVSMANRNIMPDLHSLKIWQKLLISNLNVSSKEDRIKIIKT